MLMLKPKLMTANLFLTSLMMSKTKEVLRLWVESKKCLFRTAIHFLDNIQASFSLLCTPHTRIIIIIQPVEEAASEADAVRDGADVVSGLAIVGRDTEARGENSMKP